MMIRSQDRDTLRTLAARYMEYAQSAANHEKRELWRSLNDMRMQKPMVTIHQMPWHELDVDGFLTCTVEDPYFRGIENDLRCEIYKWEHLPADMVLNPYIILPRPIANTGFGLETRALEHKSGSVALSHLFEDQLAEMEDVKKIQAPRLTLDEARAEEILSTAHPSSTALPRCSGAASCSIPACGIPLPSGRVLKAAISTCWTGRS